MPSALPGKIIPLGWIRHKANQRPQLHYSISDCGCESKIRPASNALRLAWNVMHCARMHWILWIVGTIHFSCSVFINFARILTKLLPQTYLYIKRKLERSKFQFIHSKSQSLFRFNSWTLKTMIIVFKTTNTSHKIIAIDLCNLINLGSNKS